MLIAADAIRHLENRTVFVTGCGRSGTSILGALLSTLDPVYYVFEPVVLRLLGPLLLRPEFQDQTDTLVRTLASVLFEDHIIPQILGRRVDITENSMSATAISEGTHKTLYRSKILKGRKNALAWIAYEDPVFVIKLPEMQPFARILLNSIPGSKLIHIYRDGRDVVASAVSRGWHTDEWYHNHAVEWVQHSTGLTNRPYYVDVSPEEWTRMNPETRAACSWRCNMPKGEWRTRPEESMVVYRYEGLKRAPEDGVFDLTRTFNLRETEKTAQVLSSIKTFHQEDRPDPTPKIQEPELSRFQAKLKDWEYVD